MDESLLLWVLLGLALAGGGYAVYTATVGLRNNNPGNIRWSASNNWQGQTGQDSNGFCVFDTPQDGIRALAVLLLNYYNKYDLNTVENIITKWAPPSENDTVTYYTDVADAMGVNPGDTIDLTDPNTLTALVNAIITEENGINPYPDNVIALGVTNGLSAAA